MSSPPTAARSTEKGDASEIYPLAELDRMLPRCDALLIAAGLGPETRGLHRRPPFWR